MSIIVSTELKSDLEDMYRMTGEILTQIDLDDAGLVDTEIIKQIRLKVSDMEAILQKDIFTCDYLISKEKITGSLLCDFSYGDYYERKK
ncbi:MAG TPA: hypothetical protein VIO64_11940 [Pseudobacteroides sp.]|uniref:hypothetical protein n=1 Tax=Pseudobacteroides sp. TaxID=1968840 RepID=UPI002F925879